MYKVGVFPGKFTPPHRGHINAILQAGTQCETLYVVVSHNQKLEDKLYAGTKVKPISMIDKIRWLAIELQDFNHIKIIALDETDIPVYPYGWEAWSRKLNLVMGMSFDVIFGGDVEYENEGYTKYFPGVQYELYDSGRTIYPISATMIRNDPFKYWDYILDVAKYYFSKKVLVVGTESCGKTTLTNMLSKIFNTSWAREEGRYYSTKYLGKNESVFKPEDFFNICIEQRQAEERALQHANKIVFFDTDAVITQFYCELYLGITNPKIETFVDKDRYDILLMLKPDVQWVDDGFRWNDDMETRVTLHNRLKQMFIDRGFGDKIIEIGGNYNERLNQAINVCNGILTH